MPVSPEEALVFGGGLVAEEALVLFRGPVRELVVAQLEGPILLVEAGDLLMLAREQVQAELEFLLCSIGLAKLGQVLHEEITYVDRNGAVVEVRTGFSPWSQP